MYAPVLLPDTAPVAQAVREMEARIVLEEGRYSVAGRFYANESDAAIQRRWYAERIVRREALQNPFCAWCHERFTPDDRKVQAGCREIHAEPCAAEYDEFTSPTRRVA
jgi:hypothetical protein